MKYRKLSIHCCDPLSYLLHKYLRRELNQKTPIILDYIKFIISLNFVIFWIVLAALLCAILSISRKFLSTPPPPPPFQERGIRGNWLVSWPCNGKVAGLMMQRLLVVHTYMS